MKYERLLLTAAACLLTPQFPALAQCTQTTDCGALGYTEASCPDGGIKCPFGDKWACGAKKVSCVAKSCAIGDVLYADKKCYACLPNALPDPVPIGVVFSSGKAVALSDVSRESMIWSSANSKCSSYSAGGITGWRLPTKDELLAMYSNRSSVVQGFSNVGGKDFRGPYWSSTPYKCPDTYSRYHWIVYPSNGGADPISNNLYYARPVLDF